VNKDESSDANSVQQISLKLEFGWFLSEEFERLRHRGIKEVQRHLPDTESELKEISLHSNKETGSSVVEANGFECYRCQFKTEIKSEYEKHVLAKHPRMLCYPNRADLERLGIAGKGKSWEI
jgi:hypothetical protein